MKIKRQTIPCATVPCELSDANKEYRIQITMRVCDPETQQILAGV